MSSQPQVERRLERPIPSGDAWRRLTVNRVARVAKGQLAALVMVVVIIALVTQAKNRVFLTEANLIDVLRAGVTTFIVGCGATLVFTGGGLDLSVGAVFTVGAVVAGEGMRHGVPWPVAIIFGLAAGAALGLVNAGLILFARVPPIISTLSTLYAVSGLALVITAGNPITPLPSGFGAIGQDSLGAIPWLVIYAVLVGAVCHVFLAKTGFGYDVQAMGGNESAALTNGVRVRRVKMLIYAISGGIAALAGILYAARTGTADPQAGGTDITLEAIAAVLVGGTSLFGGIGTIPGTALGTILFAEISNALTVAAVNPLYQSIIIGAILAAAVALDSWRRSQAFKVSRNG